MEPAEAVLITGDGVGERWPRPRLLQPAPMSTAAAASAPPVAPRRAHGRRPRGAALGFLSSTSVLSGSMGARLRLTLHGPISARRTIPARHPDRHDDAEMRAGE